MRSSHLIATTATALSLLGGSGVAHAEPPWSAPQTVVAASHGFSRPSLAFTGDGHPLALLTGVDSRDGLMTEVFSGGSGAFTPLGRVPFVAGPAVYGRTGVALLQAMAPRGRARITRLGVSLGSAPRTLGRVRQLARVDASRSGVVTAAIAGNRRGDVAAAWLEPRAAAGAPEERLDVRVALRRHGQRFGRPVTVGQAVEYVEGGTLFDLALGENGDVVIAFQRSRSKMVSEGTLGLAVRVRRAGRGFGPLQTLGRSFGSSSVDTAVAPTGAVVVAWGTQDGGEGVEHPWTVRAATLRSGARHFSAPQLLDPGRVARPAAPVTAAIAADGTATVAWSGIAVANNDLVYPARVATAGRSMRFGATAQLAPNGAAWGVVTGRDGTTTVLWGRIADPEGESVDQVLASRRAPGASAFAAPEILTQGELATNYGSIAIDPQTGRPAALWIGAPAAPGAGLADLILQPRYSARG